MLGARRTPSDRGMRNSIQAVPPVTLPPLQDFARTGEWCAAGTHVVIVPIVPMASVTMRGLMYMSVLNSTRTQLHGARVTYVQMFSGDKHLGADLNASARVSRHFELYGPPSACIILKYHAKSVRDMCAQHGALTLLDCIDNRMCLLHSATARIGAHLFVYRRGAHTPFSWRTMQLRARCACRAPHQPLFQSSPPPFRSRLRCSHCPN